MKRCAIITPGFLPVPAVLGGAVEVLIEELIIANEKNPKYIIDLYTVDNPKLNDIRYKYCNIIQISSKNKLFFTILKKIKHLIFRKILRNKENQVCEFGLAVNLKMFGKKYDYIIVENNALVFNSLYKRNNMIYHLHNNLDQGRPPFIIKKIVKNCICTLSVSKYLQHEVNNISLNEKNKVLYNCVDFDVFNENIVNKKWQKEFKNKYGIKDDDFIFYYSGRIAPEKGVLELLTAFDKLSNKISNIKLLIVGKGWFGKNDLSDYEKKLYEISKSKADKIIFTGFIDHNFLPNVLSLANCVVIPSTWEEPFGVVALEAMAMKKAIISTKSGGLIEPLDGCSVMIDNDINISDNLYESMLNIYNDKELREKLEKFSFEKVINTKEFDSKNYFDFFWKTIEGSEVHENRKFNKE